MEIIDNKGLLMQVDDPSRILNTIPKSKPAGDGKVVVYWGIDEAQQLTKLGYKNVPSPIKRDYDFSGRFKPFKHQIETASSTTIKSNPPFSISSLTISTPSKFITTNSAFELIIFCLFSFEP